MYQSSKSDACIPTWHTAVLGVKVNSEVIGTRLTNKLAESRYGQETVAATKNSRGDWKTVAATGAETGNDVEDVDETTDEAVVTSDTAAQ